VILEQAGVMKDKFVSITVAQLDRNGVLIQTHASMSSTLVATPTNMTHVNSIITPNVILRKFIAALALMLSLQIQETKTDGADYNST
jgi:hypothetical protein